MEDQREKVACILHVETGSSLKWTYFSNTGPRERLSTLNSWQGMEGRILSSGESIRQYLLNKSSPGDGIRGNLYPFLAMRGYLDLGS